MPLSKCESLPSNTANASTEASVASTSEAGQDAADLSAQYAILDTIFKGMNSLCHERAGSTANPKTGKGGKTKNTNSRKANGDNSRNANSEPVMGIVQGTQASVTNAHADQEINQNKNHNDLESIKEQLSQLLVTVGKLAPVVQELKSAYDNYNTSLEPEEQLPNLDKGDVLEPEVEANITGGA